MSTLYYIHDPMCSWCWAFRPVWQQVLKELPKEITVTYLLGGLATDSDLPMDEATRQMIQHHWRRIQEKVPNIEFNYDFWTLNTPKRSTYPACRAIIAAKKQSPSKEEAMILAIQQAYYLNAQNPSNDDTLSQCAISIGLDLNQFQQDLHSPSIQAQLIKEIHQAKTMLVSGYPSLILEKEGCYNPITIDYINADKILNQILLKNTQDIT